MNASSPQTSLFRTALGIPLALCAVAFTVVVVLRGSSGLLQAVQQRTADRVSAADQPMLATSSDSGHHSDAPGEHHTHDSGPAADAHPGHVAESAISLSKTGLQNIDFQAVRVKLSTFERSMTLPAMVVERPGRSQMHVSAPLTGVITRIYAMEGAAVQPNSPMFDIRLTHEELVAAQRDFLQSAESLDVIQREIERLQAVGEGVVAGKRIVEQQYELQKLLASLRAARQALLLHGLMEAQIDQIVATRQLLQFLTIQAPAHSHDDDACDVAHLYHVQQLPVKLGQQVTTGETLCVLADHCELFIEGRAFEDDATRLREAARQGWDITAKVVAGRRQTELSRGLKLLYLADHIDAETRAFRFYVRLPNSIELDRADENGSRYIAWKYNPGQRMELRIPTETWENRLVLPVESVIDEGVESYVFQQNGTHFDRVPVHITYRDNVSAVLAANGVIQPGDFVVARGAYQMHLALKNRSGGGIDPHAGHSH